MNENQKVSIAFGVIIFVAMCIYPPQIETKVSYAHACGTLTGSSTYEVYHGYNWFLQLVDDYDQYSLHWRRFLLQVAVLGVVIGTLVHCNRTTAGSSGAPPELGRSSESAAQSLQTRCPGQNPQ